LSVNYLKIRKDEKEIMWGESYKRMHSERVIACEYAVINELEKYDGSIILE